MNSYARIAAHKRGEIVGNGDDFEDELYKPIKFSTELKRRMENYQKKKKVLQLKPKVPEMDAYRSKISEIFVQLIGHRGAKLEKIVFNWAIDECLGIGAECTWISSKFRHIYNVKVRSLLFNLSNETNPKFINDVKNGVHRLKDLPFMTKFEIYPELWNPIIEQRKQKELFNLMLDKELKEMVGMFKCPECNCSCTSFYSVQTRSADEPMTNYITCHACDYRWKD